MPALNKLIDELEKSVQRFWPKLGKESEDRGIALTQALAALLAQVGISVINENRRFTKHFIATVAKLAIEAIEHLEKTEAET